MYKFKQKLLIIFKENKVVGLTIILSLILIISLFTYGKNKNNVLITPHVAWGSKTARDLLIKKIYLNIENFLKNR